MSHSTSGSSSSSSVSPNNAGVAPALSGGRCQLYRGIRWRKSGGKWVSEIREPKTPNRIWLGSFSTPEMAAVAYDVAARALKGVEAKLNFPNSASLLPVPASMSPRDIRAAAATAVAAVGARAVADHVDGRQIDNVVSERENDENLDEFFDEDLVFDMPNVLRNMAQGMLMSPPRIGHNDYDDYDDFGDNVRDESLWD